MSIFLLLEQWSCL